MGPLIASDSQILPPEEMQTSNMNVHSCNIWPSSAHFFRQLSLCCQWLSNIYIYIYTYIYIYIYTYTYIYIYMNITWLIVITLLHNCNAVPLRPQARRSGSPVPPSPGEPRSTAWATLGWSWVAPKGGGNYLRWEVLVAPWLNLWLIYG